LRDSNARRGRWHRFADPLSLPTKSGYAVQSTRPQWLRRAGIVEPEKVAPLARLGVNKDRVGRNARPPFRNAAKLLKRFGPVGVIVYEE
jgi:hypothetical protein